MKQALVILCWTALLGVGCTHNRSRLQPYAPYVGKTVTLQRPIDLWSLPRDVFVASYYLSDGDQFGYSEHIATLPKGTELFIRKVVWYYGIDATYVFAVGVVTDPLSGKRVRFEYNWNFYGFKNPGLPNLYDGIGRAPW